MYLISTLDEMMCLCLLFVAQNEDKTGRAVGCGGVAYPHHSKVVQSTSPSFVGVDFSVGMKFVDKKGCGRTNDVIISDSFSTFVMADLL